MREDWVEVELGDLAKFIDYRGRTPRKTASGIPLITAKNVRMGYIKEEPKEYIDESDYENWMTRGIPEKGDVLFTTEAPMGYVAQLKTDNKIALAQRLITFQPVKEIENTFLKFSLMSPYFQTILDSQGTGTTVKGIKAAKLKLIKIRIAPLPIQRAIVAKIEELFSALDKGIADLKKAQAQLKIYRQAVLKKAFEGELTKENELPEIIKLGTVIDKPRYGTSKKCSLTPNGKAVLRIPNIGNGIVDENELKYAVFDEKEISTLQLNKGDILTIRSNGSIDLVGKCALITKKDINCLYAGYLIRLRPNIGIIDSKFLLYSLKSHDVRVQIESKAKSTSGVNNINAGELASLEISHFKLETQHQIVQEIESRLSVCDKVEQSIAESLEKAKALRQSILKKAFAGSLLSAAEIAVCKAAPDYEPASVLLEKMKVAKATKQTKVVSAKKVVKK